MKYSKKEIQELAQNSPVPDDADSLFNEALRILRDLAELQNGAPLIKHEEDYNKTMKEVWDFLEANETNPPTKSYSEQDMDNAYDKGFIDGGRKAAKK